MVDYTKIDQADYMSHEAILTYTRAITPELDAEGEASYARSWVSSSEFNDILTLRTSVACSWNRWITIEGACGFSDSDYFGSEISFRDRDSRTQRAEAIFDLTILNADPAPEITVGFIRTWNNANGTDFDFRSNALTLEANVDLPSDVTLEILFTITDFTFVKDNSLASDGSPFAFARQDNQRIYSVGLERTFLDRSGYVPEVDLFFGMQIKNNDSNIGTSNTIRCCG